MSARPHRPTARVAHVHRHLALAGRLRVERQPTVAAEHRALHDKYRTDDNAVERAVTLHRSRNPAADHAAEAVAIYDLQRPEALAAAIRANEQDQRAVAVK